MYWRLPTPAAPCPKSGDRFARDVESAIRKQNAGDWVEDGMLILVAAKIGMSRAGILTGHGDAVCVLGSDLHKQWRRYK